MSICIGMDGLREDIEMYYGSLHAPAGRSRLWEAWGLTLDSTEVDQHGVMLNYFIPIDLRREGFRARVTVAYTSASLFAITTDFATPLEPDISDLIWCLPSLFQADQHTDPYIALSDGAFEIRHRLQEYDDRFTFHPLRDTYEGVMEELWDIGQHPKQKVILAEVHDAWASTK